MVFWTVLHDVRHVRKVPYLVPEGFAEEERLEDRVAVAGVAKVD